VRQNPGNRGTTQARQRRGRSALPLPLLLVFAIGAVLADRLRVRGRGPLVVAASLLVCVALSGFGVALAGHANSSASGGELPSLAASVTPDQLAQSDEPPLATATLSPAPATAPPPATSAPTSTAVRQPATQAVSRPLAPTVTATTAPQPQATAPQSPATATAVPPTPTLTVRQATPRGTTVIPILMYHYVRVVDDPKDTIGIGLSVPPERFAAQMQYLADHGYTTLTMSDVYAILAGQQPLPAKPIALTFDDGYRDFYTAAWPILKQHHFKATSYIITNFIGWDAYMTWAMLQELDKTGQIEFGAHTLSHLDLSVASAEKSWAEIVGSKSILEQGLGHPISAFCYPSGKYTASVVAQVKKAGYSTATTVEYGVKQNIQNPYTMPRVRVNGPDSLATWVGKLP
jgi:peptidoglycan/xylan/chitin deacetylase (PgdA/CDA1 family)